MAKPKQIDVVSGKLTRRRVFASWMQGDAYFDLDENENPLPSMAKAMAKLARVAASIIHAPADYADGLRVVSVTIGSKGGARTVALSCRKALDDASKEFSFTTPERLLAHPTEEGAYSPPLKKEHADAVDDAVEEFRKYILGQRAQGTLPLDDGDDDESGAGQKEDPAQEKLPGVDAPVGKKGRGKK